jgi:hypothetical protein
MTTTARVTPVGVALDDGFSTKIALAADANVSFWERSVKPFGMAGGDPIDVTTMFNTTYRTKALRQLLDGTPVSGSAAYDPQVLDQIIALVNVNGWITIHHPNGDTWDFVGGLTNFDPQEHAEGELPLANFEIVPTFRLAGAETAPVFTDNST